MIINIGQRHSDVQVPWAWIFGGSHHGPDMSDMSKGSRASVHVIFGSKMM